MRSNLEKNDTVNIEGSIPVNLAASLIVPDDLELELQAPVRFTVRDGVLTNIEPLKLVAVPKR